jgi:hypothetical protein
MTVYNAAWRPIWRGRCRLSDPAPYGVSPHPGGDALLLLGDRIGITAQVGQFIVTVTWNAWITAYLSNGCALEVGGAPCVREVAA